MLQLTNYYPFYNIMVPCMFLYNMHVRISVNKSLSYHINNNNSKSLARRFRLKLCFCGSTFWLSSIESKRSLFSKVVALCVPVCMYMSGCMYVGWIFTLNLSWDSGIKHTHWIPCATFCIHFIIQTFLHHILFLHLFVCVCVLNY